MSHNINKSNFLPASRSLAFTKRAWHLAGGYPLHCVTACEDLLFAQKLFSHKKLKSTIRKSAWVEWAPPKTLKHFFRDIKNHTIGNVEAGYSEHLSRNYLVLMRYIVAWPIIAILLLIPSFGSKIILISLLTLYLLYPSIKFYKVVKSPLHIIYFGILQITADLAVIKALLTPSKTKFQDSYNNQLLIDYQNKLVHKISKNKQGNINLENNYKFLKSHQYLNIAKPEGIIKINNKIITDESLLPGKSISLRQVNPQLIKQIFIHLKPLYLNHQKAVTIKGHQIIKTQIHGDLTHDNVLRHKNKLYFIDFDRSGLSFAEFDYMLFNVYLKTKKAKNPDYKLLFANIKALKHINQFYKVFPRFKQNKKHFKLIKKLFLERMHQLSLQNHDYQPNN